MSPAIIACVRTSSKQSRAAELHSSLAGHSILEGRDSYSEEEADFLNELLVKQVRTKPKYHVGVWS